MFVKNKTNKQSFQRKVINGQFIFRDTFTAYHASVFLVTPDTAWVQYIWNSALNVHNASPEVGQ